SFLPNDHRSQLMPRPSTRTSDQRSLTRRAPGQCPAQIAQRMQQRRTRSWLAGITLLLEATCERFDLRCLLRQLSGSTQREGARALARLPAHGMTCQQTLEFAECLALRVGALLPGFEQPQRQQPQQQCPRSHQAQSQALPVEAAEPAL